MLCCIDRCNSHMRHIADTPLLDHAFEHGDFVVREAHCPSIKFVKKEVTLCLDLSFPDIETASFNALRSDHKLAVICSGVEGKGP